MPKSSRPGIAILLLVLVAPAFGAPTKGAASAPPPAFDDSLFAALEPRLIGPFRGGRSTAVAGVRSEPHTFYLGTTGGGVWKTTDAGLTWRNISDSPRPDRAAKPSTVEPGAEGIVATAVTGDRFGSASVGAIAVAESDPNVVVVGMGSACVRGNVSAGDGVYRSTDGGATWRHVGLENAGQIARLRIHPDNPDLLYAAVLGHAFGPSPQRGVFRSRDGGESWQRVLFVGDRAGAIDLVMDGRNPRVLYAATWQAERKPWAMTSGGTGSGVFKSTDGGDTWQPLTKGLPDGIKGRIGVAVSPAAPQRVWVLLEHAEKGGLYRSDDAGASFELINDDRNYVQRAWYYTHVYADPTDPDTVYVLNVAMWKSTNGGKSFDRIRTPHGDNHDLWIHPDDPRVMIEANDGGGTVSLNGGRTWTAQDGQPTAEVYRVAVDQQFPYWVYGSQQDNSSFALASRTADGGIGREDFAILGGCESGHVAIDPRQPTITYSGCYGGTIGRFDRVLGQEREVTAWPQLAVGQKAADLRYRFQWNAPIRISPHDPSTLYHASNVVHRSRDEGQSWEVISPDLTRNERSKQDYSGGPITWDNTGVEVYGTVFAFEESAHAAGLLWAGSDDGLVHLSRDGGASWTDVTPPQLPEWGTVNAISLSPHAAGRAFVVVHRYRQDDFRPYLFRTDDYGTSWKALTDGRNGIPVGSFVRAVREDPVREGLLFAGTEYGLYVSFDAGGHWQPLAIGLPQTPVTDLSITGDDLVIATQGRSIWILDDLGPVREMTLEVATAATHLFQPATTPRFGGGSRGNGEEGQNPPRGVSIYFLLSEDLTEEGAPEVTLEIRNSSGAVIRRLSSQQEEPAAPNPFAAFAPSPPRKLAAARGLNRFVWNFRHHDANLVSDAVLWGVARGPEGPPGQYTARLVRGEWSAERSFEVTADPRLGTTQEEHLERYRLAKQIWQRLTESHDALRTLRSVREQVAALQTRLEEAGIEADLEASAKALGEKLDAVELAIHQTKAKASQDVLNFPPKLDNDLLFLQGVVESADSGPTDSAQERFAELDGQLAAIESELASAIEVELAAFNQQAAAVLPQPVLPPKPRSQ